MEVAMATHLHFHPHSHHPIREYAMVHPYAPEWAILAVVTVAALLLLFWNT
jgi:hypothetical protein